MWVGVEEGRRLPHDAVEGCDAEKVPFWGDPAPELVSHQQYIQEAEFCTHESWTIDLSPAFGFDE